MSKVIWGVVGVAALGAGFVLLSGFRGHGGCGGHGGHGDPARMQQMIGAHIDDVLDDLQATPEQRTRILAVKDRLLAEAKALHAGGDIHRQLLAQWDAPQPDVAAVHAMVDQRADAMKAFAHHVADGLAEVHGLLTPEQRAKLSKKAHRRVDQ
jgi:periplasmic protein CpxP/Spy